jgi:large repetitive protein
MDGFTVTISLTFDVIIGQQNTIKLGIADTGDASLDSWLFIKAESLQTAFVPENDSVTTPANVPASVDLTANDFNLNGGALDIIAINGTTLAPGGSVVLDSGVTVTLNGGGNVTVTGDGVNAVSDTFTYTVQNQDGQTGNAIVSVNITAPVANSPPVAVDDGFAAGEDDAAAVRGNALSNDSDPDGNPLSAVAQTNVAGSNGGLFSINAAGQVTFNPNGAFEGLAAGQTATTSFTYTVSDGQGGTDTATVTVTVTGANDAPVAVDDGFAAGEDDAAAVVGNALTNDSDVDGGTLAATPQTNVAGSHGGLFSINAAGQVTFNPNGEFEGLAVGQTATTSFTYTVSDGPGRHDTATVTVTVTGANDAPEPGARQPARCTDRRRRRTDHARWMSAVPSPTSMATRWATAPAVCRRAWHRPGDRRHQRHPGQQRQPGRPGQRRGLQRHRDRHRPLGPVGRHVFSWTIGNPAPVAVNDDLAAGEDDAAAVVGNALGNDSDPDGDTLSATPQSNVAGSNGGLFSIDAAGQVTFDPNGAFEGLAVGQTATTSFTYTVSDGQGGSDTATVTVTVTGANDAPVAVDDSVSTDEDTPLTIDVLANDSDTDGDTLTVTTATAGNGTVVINLDGTITYTPDADFHGSDTISYTISDGNGGTATATVTVTVNPVNDAPTLVPGSQPGAQTGDDGQTDHAAGCQRCLHRCRWRHAELQRHRPAAGPGIDPVTGTISGTLSADASQGGPASDGVYSVTVTATDPSGATVDSVFSWTVGNPAPVALNDDFAAGEDDAAAVVGNALGNDSDPDGDTLSATVQSNVAGSNGGLFSIDAAGAGHLRPQRRLRRAGRGPDRHHQLQLHRQRRPGRQRPHGGHRDRHGDGCQ